MNDPTIDAIAPQAPVAVALAVLYAPDFDPPRFLMQLRDDLPDILYPGHWGLFGGHLEPGETPEAGLRRELDEELGYVPPAIALFRRYETPRAVRHIFQASLPVPRDRLVLGEGQDLDWVTVADLQAGERFSAKTGDKRPLGAPHRQILLDFAAELAQTRFS